VTLDLDAILARAVPGSRVVSSWQFAGGLSAIVRGVEVEHADGTRARYVVRKHDQRIENEFKVLSIVHTCGLPVPQPVHCEDGVAVLTYLDGDPLTRIDDPAAMGEQLARHLAAIHAIDGAQPDLAFLPDRADLLTRTLAEPVENVDERMRESSVRAALARCWPPPAAPRRALLHGDYWPGNLLVRAGRIVGIIDWEQAATGDALFDVATLRLDLWWAFGRDATDAFTEHYVARTGIDTASLPRWSLLAALRPCGWLAEWNADWHKFGRTDVTLESMYDAHRAFLDEALAGLDA
jgi:aminoglycoside phosphotransferase (APT) family kinase protein